MKRQGEIYDYFVKRSKSGKDQEKTDLSPDLSNPDGFHQASQESQIQPSPPSPGQSIYRGSRIICPVIDFKY